MIEICLLSLLMAPKSKCTGRSDRAPRRVSGPIPPAPSSTGRSFYLFLGHETRAKGAPEGPWIASGTATAIWGVGGSFIPGPAPEGFANLYSALNAAIIRFPDIKRVPVVLPPDEEEPEVRSPRARLCSLQ